MSTLISHHGLNIILMVAYQPKFYLINGICGGSISFSNFILLMVYIEDLSLSQAIWDFVCIKERRRREKRVASSKANKSLAN